MQSLRKTIFLLFFSVSAFAQTTYSCPLNQYVTTQLVNTGQGCSTLPTSVTINGAALPSSTTVVGTNSSGQVVAVPSQSAATVLAAPSGAAGVPTFRALVAADIPTIPSTKVSGLANSATTDATNATNITSGTLPAAQLPTATASAFGAVKPDGTTITIAGGVISSTGSGGSGSAVGAYLTLAPITSISTAASTTVYIGASNLTTTGGSRSLYYATIEKAATITSVEYIVDTNGSGGLNCTGCTFSLFDLTTSTTLPGTTVTFNGNVNTPFNEVASGLSATVSANDQIQALFTTPSGTTTRATFYRTTIYMQ